MSRRIDVPFTHDSFVAVFYTFLWMLACIDKAGIQYKDEQHETNECPVCKLTSHRAVLEDLYGSYVGVYDPNEKEMF